jgi:2-oxoglutarate dehydrogenase E2 component (dihydrolipoamide succinyltransferase)
MPVMRQKIAEHMLASRRTSAHVTTIFEVDLTSIRELRSFFGERFEERSGARLTYLPFIIQAVARSLRKFPVLNASVEGKNVRFRGHVNIGIAVALENGLVVPVIRQADAKDLVALARAVQDLARRARSKELVPDEVKDGTFTITNPGVFGSIIGTPIIHQPQVAILCVGAVVKRPVVLPGTDAIAVRSMAHFSLTFDHRLIDGAIGDRFLGDVKSTLENASIDALAGLK